MDPNLLRAACFFLPSALLLPCLHGSPKLFCFCCVRKLLHKYANEDVSLGAWFIGLEVEHVDEKRLCCGSTNGNLTTSSQVLFFNLRFGLVGVDFSKKECPNQP